jgi:hypothetical protein
MVVLDINAGTKWCRMWYYLVLIIVMPREIGASQLSVNLYQLRKCS